VLRLASAVAILLSLVWVSGCIRTMSCDAADTNGFRSGCSGPSGYVWNGTACVWTQSCVCTGDDCQGMFRTRDACESAHIHCGH
jgi:hypothetical protein